VGVLGGFDLAQPLPQGVGGGLVAGGAVGRAVGEEFGEQGAAFGPEDLLGEEPVPSRELLCPALISCAASNSSRAMIAG
jgi:hypothetical protein